ncbi:MAG: SufD family Fe-S cluster assembly protein [Candidatus Peribacteraceae bacterium]|nr:SufD family Fe-S cluster assembly protein [Candidatus Peribacteraceae bacterium]
MDASSLPPGLSLADEAGGMRLQAARGVRIEKNVELPLAEASSLHVSLAEDAALVLMVEVMGGGEHSLACVLAPGASLTLLVLAEDLPAGTRVTQSMLVGEGARARTHIVTAGGVGTEHALVSTVEGRGGVSAVDWIFAAADASVLRLSATNVFRGREGGGEILMKGIVRDRAQVRCDGRIEIGAGGGGTDTYLTQNVLMLDATAKVDAVPALEIKTNDVKAGHAATVTKVSEEDLFYMTSRGLGREEAYRLYVQGFLADMLSRIADEEQRGRAAGLLEAASRP